MKHLPELVPVCFSDSSKMFAAHLPSFPPSTNWQIYSTNLGLVLDIWICSYFKVPHRRVITSRRMRLLFLPETSMKHMLSPISISHCNPPKRIKTRTPNKPNSSHDASLIDLIAGGHSTSSANEVHGSLRNSKYSNIKTMNKRK